MKFVPSPNYTPGRQGKAVKYVVIHWMVGTLSSTDAVFKNSATQTSAHYGIENTKVHQYVKEGNTAYHAGNWNANLQSIGIEHSAAPGRPATNATYNTSIKLIADICKRYKLNPDKAIVPHKKFTATQCPGTMDLNRIKAGVKAKLKGAKVATKAEITKAYQDLLGRKPDAGGLKHYLAAKKTIAWVKADIKKSAEYKKRQKAIAARKKAEEAKRKAEAAKKAAEKAKAEEAERKAKEAEKAADEAQKKAEETMGKLVEDNNKLLKQILTLLQSLVDKVTSIFK